jgi:hypothetical protein
MTCVIQAAGTIELFFYGELPAAERAEVQSHLRLCAECQQALEDLAVIRAALASRPEVAAPPGGDWAAFMTRLDDAIRRTSGGWDGPGDSGRDEGSTRPALVETLAWQRRIVPYLAVAALLALVTASVLMRLRQPSGPVPASALVESGQTGPREIASPRPANAGLVSLSGQHFERSKLVVLGLATKDATKPGEDSWGYERELASTLLDDTRLYRQAAEERGMKTLAGVMRDLELVLLQTSMSENPDGESLEQLQRLIRRRDLLTKMNAVYTGGPP